jgi:hypothetical protein
MLHSSSEYLVIFRVNCLRHVKSDYRCNMSKYRHITYSETNLMLLSPWKPHNKLHGTYPSVNEMIELNVQEYVYMNIKRDVVI